LDNFEYHRLPVASKALAPCLWLIASEFHDGIIEATSEKLAFRLRTTVVNLELAISPLFCSGFFEALDDASNVLASRYRDALLETETEGEAEAEENQKPRSFRQGQKPSSLQLTT
jgi:hypothetical protein